MGPGPGSGSFPTDGAAAPAQGGAAALSVSCSGNPGDAFVICRSEASVATIVDGVVTVDQVRAASSITSGPPRRIGAPMDGSLGVPRRVGAPSIVAQVAGPQDRPA